MMDIKCARCVKTIQVPDNLTEGQHVRCPHCHEKFSYAMQQGGVTKDGSRTAGSDSAGAGAGAGKTPGTVNMTCGHCGKEVRVADDLKDGQHIRCPYCGEKSSYRKTSFDKKSTKITASEMQTALRTCLEDVELKRLFKCAPDGAKKVIKLTFYSTVFPERIDGHKFRVNLREIEPELTEEDLRYLIRFETDDWLKNRFKGLLDGTSNDKDEGLPCKLGVGRSGESAPIVDLNAEAIKRKMDADERERAEMAERGAAARKAAYIDALKRKAVFIAAIAALVLGGLLWFSSWDAARRKREADARARAELAQKEEIARYEEEQKAVREKQEKNRIRREQEEAKRRIEYESARAERIAKEKKLDEERVARQREIEAKEAIVKFAREKRKEIEKMFSGADLLPWNALPKQQRPGAVDGVFRCMIQSSNDTVACCEVESKADGVIKVREAGRDGVVEVEFDEWNKKLSAFGGVVHTGTQAYLFAPKAMEGVSRYLDAISILPE